MSSVEADGAALSVATDTPEATRSPEAACSFDSVSSCPLASGAPSSATDAPAPSVASANAGAGTSPNASTHERAHARTFLLALLVLPMRASSPSGDEFKPAENDANPSHHYEKASDVA